MIALYRNCCLVVTAFLFFSCTYVVWQGKSPDRRRSVVVYEYGGRQYVELDGEKQPSFDGVFVDALEFDQTGKRLAYGVEVAEKSAVVIDGVKGKQYDGIGTLLFSPDGKRVAYAALSSGRWQIVVDGKPGKKFDTIFESSLAFSEDSKKLVYAAALNGKSHIVVNGVMGPAFDSISTIILSDDSHHVAYVGKIGKSYYVVRNGMKSEAFEAVSEFAFASFGEGYAYLARKNKKWFVIRNGARQGEMFEAVGSLRFSSYGDDLFFIAKDENGYFVVKNGQKGKNYTWIRPTSFRLGPDGDAVTFVAKKRDGFVLVKNDIESPPFEWMKDPVVDQYGKRIGIVAYKNEMDYLVIDGKIEGPYFYVSDLDFTKRGYVFIAHESLGAFVQTENRRFSFDSIVAESLVVSNGGEHWGCLAMINKEKKVGLVVDGKMTNRNFDFREFASSATKTAARRAVFEKGRNPITDWVWAEMDLAIQTEK